MKTRIAGVALAAVVGACALGSVNSSQAAQISFDGSNDVGPYGLQSVSGSYNFDTRTGGASFIYVGGYTEDDTLYYQFSFNIDYIRAMIDGSAYYLDLYGYGSGIDPNGKKVKGLGHVQVSASSYGGFATNYDGFLTGNSDAIGTSYDVETTGGVNGTLLSAVPLPASAPLFGAALLALAGIGWATQRRTA